jgi:hypothetical protein
MDWRRYWPLGVIAAFVLISIGARTELRGRASGGVVIVVLLALAFGRRYLMRRMGVRRGMGRPRRPPPPPP